MAELTQARLKELLEYDPATGIFVWLIDHRRAKAGDVAGNLIRRGYHRIWVDGKYWRSHRLAWLYMYGTFPPDQIDHINRVKHDNRIANLRAVTSRENLHNIGKRVANTSGYLGVCWYKPTKKWHAQIGITVDGKYKKIHLGFFTSILDAVEARKQGGLKHWGTNSPEYM